ncbi:lipoprotein-releasing ABC transporter permease subunit [Pseudomonas rhizoryzae]|uniref:lipoprotein-releasing ABC transporter permease subunit n=1 Tax=Pseudomonas rhizoryzae TaxID=2571129 RepID=UPI0007362A97|nr:lipoprotein-releasing ABC transporter permease subunit [Pseudomonas rhizoryzae]KTT30221.1 cell division protein FtsX [Pseudomonas psychrotolerans]KTT33618.1 cell division protein FtsX [Pseudomonas psychrotolerans]KTT78713.1 cell division protein FtsX [Pseudomonas psychrotolerans]
MFRPLPIYLGLRYVRAKRRNHFVSFISLTSMIGLALGVIVMIVVLSVMNGFDREMRERVLGMIPHATVESYQPVLDWRSVRDKALQNSQVAAVAPFTQLQGMLARGKAVQSVLLNAIDPTEEPKVSIIGGFMRQGQLDDLKPGEFGIIIGSLAAEKLGVKVGDKVTYIAPEVAVTPAGVFPRMKRFTVVGIFSVGAGELDGSVGLINIEDAARLQRWPTGAVQGVRLKLHDLFQAPDVSWSIARQLPGNDWYARDWTRTHGNLYQAIGMEKTMIGLLLLLIVAVAAFNIVSTLVMVVTDKKSDIAILRTLGATPKQIMAVFMVQGTFIGVIGTAIGCVLGVIAALNVSAVLAWVQQVTGHQFLNAEVYFIDYLPAQLQLHDVLLVCGASFALSFLATLYPSWSAARTQPAEALRYE